MQGILADVNVQGHLHYVSRLLQILDLRALLAELSLDFVTFSDLELPRDLDDRHLWSHCQQHGWVLLTENRNNDGPDSLQATLADSWQTGHLPVLTLANKRRLERDADYAKRVATDLAEVMFGIAQGEYRDQPRIYLPR